MVGGSQLPSLQDCSCNLIMKQVYVGMSGGVDSSVTAALLKDQGYQVTGVFMKNWAQDLPGFKCPWREDLADAKRVAVQLGIPFKVYDFQKEYRHAVVDYMISQYQAGQTPNPDIMCNQEVKFKLFTRTALKDGADMVATGHYAKVQHQKGVSLLKKARDETKDQTYFLYRITAEALTKTLFPLGNLRKSAVRQEAMNRGLVTATKKDSVGICFVGQVGIKEFLSNYVQTDPGNIIDKNSGTVVGQHDGAIFYTIGQRHGLNVGGGLPYYVASKNMIKNEVYVTTDLNDASLWHKTFNITEVHWINDPPKSGASLQVRIRHLGALQNCTLAESEDSVWKVIPEEPFRALAPGQSAVFYDGDICLGGGVIL